MAAAPLLPTAAIPGTRRKFFTRQEVERMLASGALDGQRLELIDGQLYDKTGQNPPHASAIQNLTDLLGGLFPGRRIRIQLPMEAGGVDRDRSVPEPTWPCCSGVRPSTTGVTRAVTNSFSSSRLPTQLPLLTYPGRRRCMRTPLCPNTGWLI